MPSADAAIKRTGHSYPVPVRSPSAQQTPFNGTRSTRPQTTAVSSRSAASQQRTGSSPIRPSTTSSTEQLRTLTDRLSHYIKRVRDVRVGRAHVDAAMFFKSLDSVEKEMKSVRDLYETELTAVRSELDGANSQGRNMRSAAAETEEKNILLVERLASLESHVQSLQSSLTEKENELSVAATMMSPTDASLLARVTSTASDQRITELSAQLATERRRYEVEVAERRAAEATSDRLRREVAFTSQLHREERAELESRINTATSVIEELESKARDAMETDSKLAVMIGEFEEAAGREGSHDTAMEGLKQIVAADRSSLQATSEENSHLLGMVAELRLKVGELETECSRQKTMKSNVEAVLTDERNRMSAHIKALESRVASWQTAALGNSSPEYHCGNGNHVEYHQGNDGGDVYRNTRDTVPSYTMPMSLGNEIFSPYQQEEPFPDIPARSSPPHPLSPTPHLIPTSIVESVTNGDQTATQTTTVRPSPLRAEPTGDGAMITSGSRPVSANQRPVGPIRPKSAPATRASEERTGSLPADDLEPADLKEAGQVSDELGQGRDYFKEMFEEKERSRHASGQSSNGVIQEHEYNHCTNSSTGSLLISEVHRDGAYIRLANSSTTRDAEFGGYTIQQNVGGNPVALYRFPTRLTVPPGGRVTVYAGGAVDPIMHQPPVDFVWSEQERWGSGPECTTIVCKGNGQAVAWSTSAHRFGGAGPGSPSPLGMEGGSSKGQERGRSGVALQRPATAGSLPLFDRNMLVGEEESPMLRREKRIPPSLNPPRHPHGAPMAAPVHPTTTIARQGMPGNDNSSNNRQARSQSARPDLLPDEPNAGIKGQRMGSAPYRGFTPLGKPRRRLISNQCSKSENHHGGGVGSDVPPSPFLTPHIKFSQGIDHILAQTNMMFYPPAPRPPLHSTW